MSNDDLQAILKIYDTVADQTIWPEVLDYISDTCGARGSLIFELEGGALSTPYFSSLYDAEALEHYNRAFEELEMADHALFRSHSFMDDKVEIISDEILYSELDEFKTRSNVKYVMNAGILHRAAALLNKDNPSVSRFSVQFKSDRGPITIDERKRLNVFLPHVAKALDLGRPARQLASEHAGLLAAMDRLTIGICLLDKNAVVVASNNEFRRQEEAYPVFDVQSGSRFRLLRPEDQARFDALHETVQSHGKFGARPRKEAISAADDSFLCIELSPLNRSEEMGSSQFEGFILYSTDTSQPVHFSTEPLKDVYGLTTTELLLAEEIASGRTNAQIAERRSKSVATVNAQVKSILSKTNCANRTQFVRMLLTFSASFLVDADC